MSVFAIGDIHGWSASLDALLAALPRTDADTTVFLGDYIDRGPDSAGVVRRLLAERDAAPERTILLWGNHDDMAAAHFGLPAPTAVEYDPYCWFMNGAYETLASFGHPTAAEALRAPCPPELVALNPHLRRFWRGPDQTLYVHAGILPWQEPEDADALTLLWVRDEFLQSRQTGRTVVFGHTPQTSERPLVRPDKIGIDTGAKWGGPLTALQMPERIVYQARPNGRTARFPLERP